KVENDDALIPVAADASKGGGSDDA
ncbi:MAG: hypothetical protein QOC73_2081, partial [Actinomycetota bacterium]|nr:hypothetical protein [Actinomycetota bacterium]